MMDEGALEEKVTEVEKDNPGKDKISNSKLASWKVMALKKEWIWWDNDNVLPNSNEFYILIFFIY